MTCFMCGESMDDYNKSACLGCDLQLMDMDVELDKRAQLSILNDTEAPVI